MPYIVTQCWFPAIKADETTQKYLELMEKYPFDESVGKQIIPSAVTVNKNGYETFLPMPEPWQLLQFQLF